MRRLFTAVLAIFLSLNCFGQARTITARVVDADNQQPVKNAAVIVAGTTSGNFTNYLGFFQLELAKGYNDLIISHVGYETGKVKIPPTDKFTIELNPEKQVLKPLNLSFFPKDSLAIKADDSPVKTRDNLVRHNAEFVGGWEEFYLELGNRITKSENFKNTDSYSTVSFEVTEKGKVSVIEIDPDTSLNKDVIYKALTALEGWKPARQHNFPESQTFSIPILVDSSDVAIIPEDPALPVGGYESFYRYVGDNLRYPAEARRMGIEGKVYIQFVVQRDGSLAEVEVIKGIGAGCDIEVMRVLKGSPKWTPARNKGLPVKQRIVLPVTYLLGASGGNFDVGNIPDSALISGVVLTAYGVEREKSRLKIWESEKFEEKPLYPYTSAEIRKFVKKNKKR